MTSLSDSAMNMDREESAAIVDEAQLLLFEASDSSSRPESAVRASTERAVASEETAATHPNAQDQSGLRSSTALLQEKIAARAAALEQPEVAGREAEGEKEQEEKKRRFPLLLIGGLALGVGFFLGYILSGFLGLHDIDRGGTVTFTDGKKVKGELLTIRDDRLSYRPVAEKEASVTGETEIVSLARIKRIDLDPEEEESPDATDIPEEVRPFLGRYRGEVSKYNAILYIYWRKSGRLGMSLRFPDWGKNVFEYPYGIRIRNRQIRFIRSCSRTECRRIGSPINFRQLYHGELTKRGRVLEGKYTGTNSSGVWRVERF